MSPVSSDCPPLPTEQTELVLPFFHTPDPTQSLCPYTGGVHRLCRSRSIPQYSSSFLLHPFVLFPKGIFFVFLWTRVRRLESRRTDPRGSPNGRTTNRRHILARDKRKISRNLLNRVWNSVNDTETIETNLNSQSRRYGCGVMETGDLHMKESEKARNSHQNVLTQHRDDP